MMRPCVRVCMEAFVRAWKRASTSTFAYARGWRIKTATKQKTSKNKTKDSENTFQKHSERQKVLRVLQLEHLDVSVCLVDCRKDTTTTTTTTQSGVLNTNLLWFFFY